MNKLRQEWECERAAGAVKVHAQQQSVPTLLQSLWTNMNNSTQETALLSMSIFIHGSGFTQHNAATLCWPISLSVLAVKRCENLYRTSIHPHSCEANTRGEQALADHLIFMKATLTQRRPFVSVTIKRSSACWATLYVQWRESSVTEAAVRSSLSPFNPPVIFTSSLVLLAWQQQLTVDMPRFVRMAKILVQPRAVKSINMFKTHWIIIWSTNVNKHIYNQEEDMDNLRLALLLPCSLLITERRHLL